MPHNSNSRVMFLFSYQLAMETAQKLRNSSPVHSVRDRADSPTTIREVAKPGIALGSGPKDRGFESRLPDHSTSRNAQLCGPLSSRSESASHASGLSGGLGRRAH